MSKKNKLKKIKFIIKEIFAGKQTSTEVFTDIIISEHEKDYKNDWTRDKQGDIIKSPTVKS